MLIYRIIHEDFSDSLFASGIKGRWNSAGKKVIYGAESIPLAFLEHTIRRQGVGSNDEFKILIISIAEPVTIEAISTDHLPSNWRSSHDYSACQQMGDEWFQERKSLVLKVPSAVMPDAFNFVINTLHADYGSVQLAGVTNLVPDPRIEDILKKYRKD